MNGLTSIGVGKKIAGGFAIMAIIMVVTVIVAISRIDDSQVVNDRVFDLRTPTVLASTNMLVGVQYSLAALRGYMILGADKFKQGRTKAWENMDAEYAKLQKFSKNWTNPENVKRLDEMGDSLGKFKQAQAEIEAISGTIDNNPATKILVQDAAPRAKIMVSEITNIIDMEAKLAATPKRKALLGMMADVRGTTGLALANIRAFLLTGDDKFQKTFDKFWAKNIKRFGDLSNNVDLLSNAQRASFDKFSKARAEFKDLPHKMFAIRSSKEWNLANYWLGTKAAPQAGKILKTLNGMVKNQNQLAVDDIALASETGHTLKSFMLILGVIAVAIAIGVAFFVVRMITKPVTLAAAGLKEIADGDLTQRFKVSSNDELGKMLGDMNAMAVSLTTVVGQVRSGADAIATAANEISEGNISLSQRTEEQASSLEETASSMEEMTSTVNQNADNAKQANQLAVGARDQAEQGGEVVSRAVNAMAEINTSSKKISDIIGVIDEIAFQTNLLALNAAVEAARAGEQGRGFAVVAGEVRSLAQRSAEAAKEIKGLIQDSVQKVEQGSALVNESGEKLGEIVNSVKKVTDIVSEIAAASSEQASGIEQVNTAITQMDDMTQQNAALVEEAAAASKSMEEQASALSKQMEFFRLDSSDQHKAPVTAVANTQSEAKSQVEQWGKNNPVQRKPAAPAPQASTARTGTDDAEWEEF